MKLTSLISIAAFMLSSLFQFSYASSKMCAGPIVVNSDEKTTLGELKLFESTEAGTKSEEGKKQTFLDSEKQATYEFTFDTQKLKGSLKLYL